MIFLKFLPAGLAYAFLQVVLRFKEETELARRLKAREPEAMAELYDRYGRLTYSIIYRVVRNTAVAEDLVQETFLRVWNRVHSFDQQRGWIGWFALPYLCGCYQDIEKFAHAHTVNIFHVCAEQLA